MLFGTPEVNDETLTILQSIFHGDAPVSLTRWYVREGLLSLGLTNGANPSADTLVQPRFVAKTKGIRVVQAAYRSGRLVYVPASRR